MTVRLCAIIKSGEIRCIVPVRDNYEFGLRASGVFHQEVTLVDEIPKEYRGRKVLTTKGVK